MPFRSPSTLSPTTFLPFSSSITTSNSSHSLFSFPRLLVGVWMWPVRPSLEFSQGNCFHCCSLKKKPKQMNPKMFIRFPQLPQLENPSDSLFLSSVSHFLSPLPIFSPSAISTLSVCLTLSLFHSPCAISFSPLYHLSLLLSFALILTQIEVGGGGGGFPIAHSLPKIYFCLCSLTLLGQKRFILKKKKEKKKK